jgi:hypothetical protein
MMFHRPGFLTLARHWLCGLLLLTAVGEMARAQTAPPERWLLVFDTSAAMKKYLPATRTAVRQFLATAANGQLRPDDSLGVWSYGQRINGQFKTYNWEPAMAAQIETNLVTYVQQQRYGGDSSFSALQLPLSRIIAGSERLTIVIFCDGQSPIQFTPYDDGINQSFRDGLDERKRSEQPFVVVVRSQKGKFVGCTVSYPPGGLNLPEFPPLPKPTPAAAPPPKVAPQPVAKAEVPSLIIVGTKVGTNLNALTETAAPPAKPAPASANSPKPAVIQPPTQSPSTISSPIATNASTAAKPSQVETVLAPTKTNATTNATANATAALKPAQTNSVAAIALASSVPPAATRVAAAAVLPPTVKAAPVATSKAPVRQSGKWIGLGVVLLLAALVLAGWLVRRARRPRSSLITSSLQEPPARK